MGHLHLGHLPRTHHWKQVIALLDNGAEIPDLASSSVNAASKGLQNIPSDGGFAAIVSYIFELAKASWSSDISDSLSYIGIGSNSQKTSIDFISTIANNLSDRLSPVYPRSDVGKIAQDSFLETLSKQITGKTGSLFDEDSQSAKSLTESFRGNGFKNLMHEFYATFTSRYLSYHLGRELANHVGIGKRFQDIDSHTEFSNAFSHYCRQTIRITDEFTPGWVGKSIYEGTLSKEAVSRYVYVAFKKITSEFEKGAD